MSNFRTISLLMSFSEVFEKVIYSRLYQYINQNNILVNELYGFRSNSLTLQAPYKLINDILLALNTKLTLVEYSVTWRMPLMA